jgi:hypothetical protein
MIMIYNIERKEIIFSLIFYFLYFEMYIFNKNIFALNISFFFLTTKIK